MSFRKGLELMNKPMFSHTDSHNPQLPSFEFRHQ